MSIKHDQMQKRVRQLFEHIKQTDEAHTPRLRAFKDFATQHNLKCETVRNLYYSAVKQYKLQDAFNIEKCKHFKESELKATMRELVSEINRTKSVRQACYNLSCGDAKLMLRLQNKYRSMMKSNPEYLLKLGLNYDNKSPQKGKNNTSQANKINFEKTLENAVGFINQNNKILAKNGSILAKNNKKATKNSNITAKNKRCSNFQENGKNDIKSQNLSQIIAPKNVNLNREGTLCEIARNEPDAKILRMPKSQTLTDADINNLFMGLVKMVKRSAIENAPKALRDECSLANANLKETLARLGANTRKLEIIKCENQALKQKLDESQRLLEVTRSEFVELLNKIDKTGHIEELKDFLKSYKPRNAETKSN